jgi:hypothetical protein
MITRNTRIDHHFTDKVEAGRGVSDSSRSEDGSISGDSSAAVATRADPWDGLEALNWGEIERSMDQCTILFAKGQPRSSAQIAEAAH